MGVSQAEILKVLADPDMSYPGKPHLRPRTVFVGGRLAVVVSNEDDAIITVLWDKKEARHG
jgi:hypothetical protein